jgi:hypothetical protein
MRNALTGFSVATAGVMIARLGQGIMSTTYDPFWAFVAVASILGGLSIAMSRQLDRTFARARTTPMRHR